ncbi:signal peptidase II [Chloroflexota bacterium]
MDCLQGKWRNVAFFLTALLVVAADQPSKMWIRSYPEGQPIFEVGFFRIIHAQNTGAAFGLFQDQSLPLTIVAIIGIIAILLFVFLFSRRFPYLESKLGKPTLGLVLGGTIGNLIDRLRLGYVTDFIGVGIWPAFNIADSAITVGVILFAYSLLFLTGTITTNLSD